MNPQIKEHFCKLKLTGQRVNGFQEEKRVKDFALIEYLNSLIANREVTEFEDVGFCYWNISDNYALLRDGHALQENHQVFYEHIMSKDASYLYWLVCDATQRLTLEKDGYSDWWWSVYREAVSYNLQKTNLFAEFCAHRAALYNNATWPLGKNNFEFARSYYEVFLDKVTDTTEYPFYKIIYLALVSKFFSVNNWEMKEMAERMIPELLCQDTPNEFLIGEWKSFTTPFGKRKCAVVGIISVINALLDSREPKMASELYHTACEKGLPKNTYIEHRFID